MEAEGQQYRHYRTPFLCFGGVWLAAILFLGGRGLWEWVARGAGAAGALALFIALTFRLTRDRPPLPEADAGGGEPGEVRRASGAESDGAPDPGPGGSRLRFGLQLGVAVAFALLAAVRFRGIPVWTGLMRGLFRLGEALPIPNPNYLMNPLLYVALPGAAVLALGAGWRGIGFRKGWRAWRVIAVWSAPVVAVWIYGLASGRVGIGHTFQNGFGEEFLWRGLIQTRLARLWTPEWGLVLASLGFGWWHIGSIHDWAGDDLLLAAALNVVVQAPMGLALGVIFDRTRNLLAPSVVHVVANAVEV